MKVFYAHEFVKQFRKLPPAIQGIFREQESRFKSNWRDSRLHVKKLAGHPLTFSFRITVSCLPSWMRKLRFSRPSGIAEMFTASRRRVFFVSSLPLVALQWLDARESGDGWQKADDTWH